MFQKMTEAAVQGPEILWKHGLQYEKRQLTSRSDEFGSGFSKSVENSSLTTALRTPDEPTSGRNCGIKRCFGS